jgi:hypothetical protein
VFELRTAKGQWLRSAETATSFVLPLAPAAAAAGLAPPAPPPPAPAGGGPAGGPGGGPPDGGGGGGGGTDAGARSAGAGGSSAAERPPPPAADGSSGGGGGSAGGGARAAGPSVSQRAAAGPIADAGGADVAWDVRALLRAADAAEEATPLGPPPPAAVEEIAGLEPKAERSLMHRFSLAEQLLRRRCGALLDCGGDGAGGGAGEADAEALRALAAAAVWLRLSALRLLRWWVAGAGGAGGAAQQAGSAAPGRLSPLGLGPNLVPAWW